MTGPVRERHYTEAERRSILALSDERAMWQARVLDAAQRGFERGVAYRDSFPPRFDQAIREAFAAGQRAAAGDQAAFDKGWDACLDRFAELIGGRITPPHPTPAEITRWTRHSPKCRRRGGRQSCDYARCIPGSRADYGKPAPWDETPGQLRARVTASWAKAARRIAAAERRAS
jgi:hypothetical protein